MIKLTSCLYLHDCFIYFHRFVKGVSMKKLLHKVLPLSLLVTLPLLGMVYNALNNTDRGVYSVMTDLDKLIPFIEIFVIPYIIWFPYILLCFIFYCFKERRTYYATFISFVIGQMACFTIYYFFQTATPRPEIVHTDYLSNMIRYIYNNDNPYNCFPSIHVFTTYLMMKAMNDSNIKHLFMTCVINMVGTLIILSTIFIKQHAVLDAVFGILLASITYTIVTQIERSWVSRQTVRSRNWLPKRVSKKEFEV
jgi:membrane-associated phospholipid phosphatase